MKQLICFLTTFFFFSQGVAFSEFAKNQLATTTPQTPEAQLKLQEDLLKQIGYEALGAGFSGLDPFYYSIIFDLLPLGNFIAIENQADQFQPSSSITRRARQYASKIAQNEKLNTALAITSFRQAFHTSLPEEMKEKSSHLKFIFIQDFDKEIQAQYDLVETPLSQRKVSGTTYDALHPHIYLDMDLLNPNRRDELAKHLYEQIEERYMVMHMMKFYYPDLKKLIPEISQNPRHRLKRDFLKRKEAIAARFHKIVKLKSAQYFSQKNSPLPYKSA